MSFAYLCHEKQDVGFIDRELLPQLYSRYGKYSIVEYRKINGGVDWEDAIQQNILISSVFLFALSNSSLSSDHCKKELIHAFNFDKVVIPITCVDKDKIKLTGKGISIELQNKIKKTNWIILERDGIIDPDALNKLFNTLDEYIPITRKLGIYSKLSDAISKFWNNSQLNRLFTIIVALLGLLLAFLQVLPEQARQTILCNFSIVQCPQPIENNPLGIAYTLVTQTVVGTQTANAKITIDAIMTDFVTQTESAHASATAFIYTDTPIPTTTKDFIATE